MLKIKSIFIVLFFASCGQKLDKSFIEGNQLFKNFENLLSPEDYAKTIYFYKDQNGLWRDKNDSLVNVNIPYKNDYFTFSNSFINQNEGNDKGTNSRYISTYEDGVLVNEYYELDNLILDSTPQSKSIFIVFLNKNRVVFKCQLFSAEGDLLKASNKNFLQQIRRVRD